MRFATSSILLWIDSVLADTPYVSADDEHPSLSKPMVFNEPMQLWVWLHDKRGDWYRLTDADDRKECFVLVSRSIQHMPSERHLTVVGHITEAGDFADGIPAGDWLIGPPTPHSPVAILE